MKRNSSLGCTDKPCSCGCKELKSQSSDNAQGTSIMQDFDRSYAIQSGYAKPSAEQYEPLIEFEAQSSRTSSGFNKKELSPATSTISPSGYGKKEIVKVDTTPKEFEILKRDSTKLLTKNQQDNTGVFVAAGAFSIMLLIAVASQEKDKKRN